MQNISMQPTPFQMNFQMKIAIRFPIDEVAIRYTIQNVLHLCVLRPTLTVFIF